MKKSFYLRKSLSRLPLLCRRESGPNGGFSIASGSDQHLASASKNAPNHELSVAFDD